MKGSYSEMISKVPMEDADGLMLNETIKAGDDTAMAGSEDCLHLAVFTPKVIQFLLDITTKFEHILITICCSRNCKLMSYVETRWCQLHMLEAFQFEHWF